MLIRLVAVDLETARRLAARLEPDTALTVTDRGPASQADVSRFLAELRPRRRWGSRPRRIAESPLAGARHRPGRVP
ncbi:hypothetical protein [uncultured Thiodictyon sp.]|uniref:hypothetical protein n=1 Tax=uncultured Thiodictyon sp. TaxID=1846217 RepID=UPI0025E087DD|nr:hypothetical protein [uncultured Thiodictyon sp.]